MSALTVNNVAYSWSQVELLSAQLTGSNDVNPTILSGTTAIKWNIEHHVETNYGLGGYPVNRGFGNHKYTASITLDYNAQTQLRANMGVSTLLDIGEFDLYVSFANEFGTDDWTTETIILKGCLFNEDGFEVSQDDTSITKEFNLNPYSIEIQATA